MSTIIIKRDGGSGVTLPIGITDVTDLQGELDGKAFKTSALTVIYVAKHGGDTNDGLGADRPVLTLGKAIELIDLMDVEGTIEILDAGVYTENIELSEGVNLDAPSATLVGTLSIASNCYAKLNKHYTSANNQNAVNKAGGTGMAHYFANVLDTRGTAGTLTGCQGIRNVSNGSVIFSKVGVLYVGQGGVGVGDSAVGFGHIHFWTPDLYLGGDGAIGINAVSNGSNIIGYIDHVLEINAPDNTIGIFLNHASAIVKATITEIIADKVYDVDAGSLHIVCSKLTGTREGTPVVEISKEYLDTKIDANTAIVAGTGTKITYDTKGLITSGTDALISDISGLTDALASKSDTSHTHVESDITDLRRAYIIELFDNETDVVVDYEHAFLIPEIIGTNTLISANATVFTAGVTGNTTVSILNGATAVLSTDITIASTETSGSGVIDTDEDDVAENDLITLTVETVSTTAPKGLTVELIFG